METLRQIEIAEPGWTSKNIDAVMLIAPDIAVDLFLEQASRFASLPDPFVISVSERDRVLALSRRVNLGAERLGNTASVGDLADLKVVILDTSKLESSDPSGHFDFARSGAVRNVFRNIRGLESIMSRTRSNPLRFAVASVIRTKNATQFVLAPNLPSAPAR
jgi:esterase/lipase superfamily enzyme